MTRRQAKFWHRRWLGRPWCREGPSPTQPPPPESKPIQNARAWVALEAGGMRRRESRWLHKRWRWTASDLPWRAAAILRTGSAPPFPRLQAVEGGRRRLTARLSTRRGHDQTKRFQPNDAWRTRPPVSRYRRRDTPRRRGARFRQEACAAGKRQSAV